MTDHIILCSHCGKNQWKASEEEDEDITMLFLTCKCGNVWTAEIET